MCERVPVPCAVCRLEIVVRSGRFTHTPLKRLILVLLVYFACLMSSPLSHEGVSFASLLSGPVLSGLVSSVLYDPAVCCVCVYDDAWNLKTYF